MSEWDLLVEGHAESDMSGKDVSSDLHEFYFINCVLISYIVHLFLHCTCTDVYSYLRKTYVCPGSFVQMYGVFTGIRDGNGPGCPRAGPGLNFQDRGP